MMKKRGPVYVIFAFKIFSLPVPTRPGTRTFWQVPDPSRPEVKNPYPSDPVEEEEEKEERHKYNYFSGAVPIYSFTFLQLIVTLARISLSIF